MKLIRLFIVPVLGVALLVGVTPAFAQNTQAEVKSDMSVRVDIPYGDDGLEDIPYGDDGLDVSTGSDTDVRAVEPRRDGGNVQAVEPQYNADIENRSSVVVVSRRTMSDADADVAIQSSSAVSSSEDLEQYALSVLAKDENVVKVESQPEEVKLTYRQKARFLGFIPVKVNTTAVVASDGKVLVRYPWFRFLTNVNRDVEEDIKVRVQNVVRASETAQAHSEASLELTAQEQAQVIEEVRNAMEMQVGTEAAADADIEIAS